MKKIIIASQNEKKIKEFNQFFAENKITNVVFEKCEYDLSFINENGNSFYENAKIKAFEVAKLYNFEYDVIADDSGLCVNSLDGFPGIYSARFNVNNDYSYKTKNNKLLEMIKDKEDKSAYFECCIVWITKDKKEYSFSGKVNGILKNNKYDEKLTFGYDPIFYYEPLNNFFSNLDLKTKNAISHRGIALNKFLIEIKRHHTQ